MVFDDDLYKSLYAIISKLKECKLAATDRFPRYFGVGLRTAAVSMPRDDT